MALTEVKAHGDNANDAQMDGTTSGLLTRLRRALYSSETENSLSARSAFRAHKRSRRSGNCSSSTQVETADVARPMVFSTPDEILTQVRCGAHSMMIQLSSLD
jgi:hypothetical protein